MFHSHSIMTPLVLGEYSMVYKYTNLTQKQMYICMITSLKNIGSREGKSLLVSL